VSVNEELESIKIGVCWFDDPKLAESGWSSEGGAAAVRVSGINELRTDTVWVSNIDYRTYRNLNLNNLPYFRDAQFMRIGVDILAKELGLADNVPSLVEKIAEIFTRTSRLGFQRFGVKPQDESYRYQKLLAPHSLPEFAKSRPAGRFIDEVEQAFGEATQANQAMTGGQRPRGSQAYSFVFPRTSYAKWLLSQAVPGSNEWRKMKIETEFGVVNGEPVKGTKAVTAKLLKISEKHACLFRVNVIQMDSVYRDFATFGAGSRTPRNWATLPEVLAMSRYARIRITDGFMTDIGIIPEELGTNVINDEFSFSRGLLTENQWVSIATPVDGKIPTAISAYLRAYDRIACNKAAAKFHTNRLTVGSYGTGRVTVYVKKGEEEFASKVALNAGMLPPLSLMEGRMIDVS